MNKYAIATHSGSFNVWAGPFADEWHGEGVFRNDARRTTVTLHNGDKVRVAFPDGIRLPRHDGNYLAIDKAISDAIEAHYAAGSLECPGCKDDESEHWRSCPRWDAPENSGFPD